MAATVFRAVYVFRIRRGGDDVEMDIGPVNQPTNMHHAVSDNGGPEARASILRSSERPVKGVLITGYSNGFKQRYWRWNATERTPTHYLGRRRVVVGVTATR